MPSDVSSLYELAFSYESPLSTLQVSPATLKFISDSLIGLLIEHEVPAIIWVKLPRAGVWRTELERYASLDELPKALYLFDTQREEADESDEAGAVKQIDADSPIASSSKMPDSLSDQAPVFSVTLPPNSPLRREYFLIVWSASFQGGVFAHRPRSLQPAKAIDPAVGLTPVSPEQMPTYGQPSPLVGAPSDRKQLLLAVCTFDSELIQQVLQALESAIAAMQPSNSGERAAPTPTDPISTASSVVTHWKRALADLPAASPSLPLLRQLFTRHLQQQEELWQRGSTYRKQAEQVESLHLQKEELLNTLRMKDDFLNNVGQELRTPLTTIKTALTLLSSPNLKPPQRQRYMDLITRECDRQSSLITSLLDLVQLQSVDQTALPPLRLSEIVPGVVSTYQPVAEEGGVQLAYTVPEDLPPVACMANWLKQIVINLLQNGIKFTPKGGQVRVFARQQGDYVQLEVRDTGIGIAPSEIPKIFDRFYRIRQVPDDSSGVGLGLTIVQQLLLHCGGSISVKSKVGEGSTFNVLLPIHHNTGEPDAFDS